VFELLGVVLGEFLFAFTFNVAIESLDRSPG